MRDECAEYGTVEGVCIPVPPKTMPPNEPGRAYIMFGSHEEASKAKPVFDGRLFDNAKVNTSSACLRISHPQVVQHITDHT